MMMPILLLPCQAIAATITRIENQPQTNSDETYQMPAVSELFTVLPVAEIISPAARSSSVQPACWNDVVVTSGFLSGDITRADFSGIDIVSLRRDIEELSSIFEELTESNSLLRNWYDTKINWDEIILTLTIEEAEGKIIAAELWS